MKDKPDWRLTNQSNYLSGVKLIYCKYEVVDKNWDHDHCDFCWEKFVEGIYGYTTLDKYHWICENCYNDFKERFNWELSI